MSDTKTAIDKFNEIEAANKLAVSNLLASLRKQKTILESELNSINETIEKITGKKDASPKSESKPKSNKKPQSFTMSDKKMDEYLKAIGDKEQYQGDLKKILGKGANVSAALNFMAAKGKVKMVRKDGKKKVWKAV